MRIMLACRVYSTHRPGGMPHVTTDRAEQLARDGHDVFVVTTGIGSGLHRQSLNSVEILYAPSEPMVYSNEFAEFCKRQADDLRPDILHLESFDRDRCWWEKPGRQAFVTMHGFEMGAYLTQCNLAKLAGNPNPELPTEKIEAEVRALRTFAGVFAISLHEQSLLEEMYGLMNVTLVYNPIHPCFFEGEPPRPPGNKTFLCAAVSGHGNRLFGLAAEAAIRTGSTLRVVGNVSRAEMPRVYDECDALIVPTAYAQGYDLTVAEALARRRPVIMSATGSYLKEFRDAKLWPGQLVPVGDVDELALAMTRPQVSVAEADRNGDFSWKFVRRHEPKEHVRNWLEAVA